MNESAYGEPSPRLAPAVGAHQIPLGHTRDISGLQALVDSGQLEVDEIVAVTGKTESSTPATNSRLDADQAIRRFLLDHGTRTAAQIDQLPMVFTEGGLGILTPQVVVFTRTSAPLPADGGSRLALGTARSVIMQPEWTGTTRPLEADVDAIHAAAREAGIDAREIEYVVGKAYYPDQAALTAARAGGQVIAEFDDGTLFRLASGSAGLAVAVAADGMVLPSADVVANRLDLWTAKAAVSANAWEPVGGEGPQTQLVAFGNRVGAGGRLRVGHAPLRDLLDAEALPTALRAAGLDVGPGPLTAEQRDRVISVYAKVSPPPDGLLRGRRQVVENPAYGTELKAAVGGMLVGYLQKSLLWISTSAVHQGPAGGGTVAAIVDVG